MSDHRGAHPHRPLSLEEARCRSHRAHQGHRCRAPQVRLQAHPHLAASRGPGGQPQAGLSPLQAGKPGRSPTEAPTLHCHAESGTRSAHEAERALEHGLCLRFPGRRAKLPRLQRGRRLHPRVSRQRGRLVAAWWPCGPRTRVHCSRKRGSSRASLRQWTRIHEQGAGTVGL
ncbi:hypothetical protein D3C72_1749210 [compost metagenome]